MHQMAITLSFKHHTQTPNLLDLRVDIAMDLQAQEKRGCWSVRGASFVAIHDPFHRVMSTDVNYADLPAECASALGIVVAATLQTPATALFLKPGPRGGVDRMSLLRAIAEMLEAFGASLRLGIDQADGLGAVETSGVFTGALHCVDQLLWLLADQADTVNTSDGLGDRMMKSDVRFGKSRSMTVNAHCLITRAKAPTWTHDN
jgi:starvation-inducible DNA-binding protein